MNCRDVQRKLSAYLDGECETEQCTILEIHLKGCKTCQKAMQTLTDTWELITILPGSKPAPYFYTRLKARMTSEEHKEKTTWVDRILIPASAIAAIAIGILVGSIVGRNGEWQPDSPLVEDDIVDALYLDHFDDFPSASLGDALFTLAVQE